MLMGEVAKAHGIHGELALQWFGSALPEKSARLWLAEKGQPPREMCLDSMRWHKGRPLVLLQGVSDRSQAESLAGAKIFLERRDLPPLSEDEAFLEDLLGCDVLLADGSRIGKLDHFEFPGDQPIWAIKTASGREVLFPARPEFIRAFDLDSRQVRIEPPEGLLEIYLA